MAKQVKDLMPNPKNPRRISKEKKEFFEASLKEYGPLYGVVHNRRSGFLVGGHQTGTILGPDAEIIIEETFDPPTDAGTVARGYILLEGEKITYRQVDFDEAKEAGAMVAANRGAGQWDFAKLSDLFVELDGMNFDLNLTMFDEEERENIVVPVTYVPPSGDPDAVSEPPANPKTNRGDIYLLGRHRLMCGDATLLDDAQKLMNSELADMVFTDPPYNIGYEGGTKKREMIKNDEMGGEDFYKFLFDVYTNYFMVTQPGAPMYVCHADTERVNFTKAFIEAGFHLSSVIIWAKNNATFGRQDYFWKHEPILYGWNTNGPHPWYGPNNEETVWSLDRPAKSADHPTMKPVALVDRALKNSTKQDHLVLDLFGGSGTTLIACEMAGRRCNTMELDPRYCDVIVRRYEELTGKKAELLCE